MAIRGRQSIPWSGKVTASTGVIETAFEAECRRLHLQPYEFISSVPLRYWAKRNRMRHYIPENLLQIWGLELNEGGPTWDRL
jgi:hypothetical protein